MRFLGNKNILVISPEPWGKSMLSKHHYAIQLSKCSNKVWFLQSREADKKIAEQFAVPGVIIVQDTYTIRGLRFLPSIFRKPIVKRMVKKLEHDCGVHFDVVWSFDNSRFFDLDCFEGSYLIHHMMDYHVDYNNRIASSCADICLGVTSGIVEKMKLYNSHSYFIHHGYSPYEGLRIELPTVKQKIKALYTGNLLMVYVNWPWLHALVSDNPDVHFFLAGSYDVGNLNPHINPSTRKEVDKIALNENVTLLGERTPGEIQGFMLDADILYFAYRSAEFPQILANSHKLMAYLGSGKPIVCHTIREYEGDDPLLYMSKTVDEYLSTFREIKLNLDHYNSEELVQRRKNWALENTYLKQIERVDKLIPTISKN